MQKRLERRVRGVLVGAVFSVCAWLAGAAPVIARATVLPEIRMSAQNAVPACVTPERLMRFLQTRNRRLNPRFKTIAEYYKFHGEGWRVRWDYAFFQMAIETNFLTYRAPNGRMGDVDPAQNNFAGIGTTGGGVPGNRFPDVSTGVLAQIQHLVVYSGERIAEPVAPRTRLKQHHILALSWKLRRPVRFSDLSRRWAVDKNYGRSIEWVAKKYRSRYCRGDDKRQRKPVPQREALPWAKSAASDRSQQDQPRLVAAPQRSVRPAGRAQQAFGSGTTAPSGLGRGQSGKCQVRSASYGGRKTLLVRTTDARTVRYTALTVHDGFERSMAESFLESQSRKGETLGSFASKDEALSHARHLCARH